VASVDFYRRLADDIAYRREIRRMRETARLLTLLWKAVAVELRRHPLVTA
jgi:hypothetical protein